ncbi:MAG: TadE/TadG family type IV pilus assembly protein [Actinomycetota bacterium]
MRRRESDGGQAAVEFVVALPMVVVAVLAVAQIGVTVRNELVVQHAAREAARAASVSADPSGAAASAARRATSLPISVSTHTSSGDVVVTVTYVDPTDVPLIGQLLTAVTHRATVTMTLEPP